MVSRLDLVPQIISLKSHIRGRNPLYRLKPEFGKKVLEIQRNQPGPVKKKRSQYFRIPTSETPPFFQKPKTAQKLQFSVFFSKKKIRKKQARKKKQKEGRTPLPTLTEVY
jgi:hypothetical protein